MLYIHGGAPNYLSIEVSIKFVVVHEHCLLSIYTILEGPSTVKLDFYFPWYGPWIFMVTALGFCVKGSVGFLIQIFILAEILTLQMEIYSIMTKKYNHLRLFALPRWLWLWLWSTQNIDFFINTYLFRILVVDCGVGLLNCNPSLIWILDLRITLND